MKIDVSPALVRQSTEKAVDAVVKAEVERQLLDNEAFQAHIRNLVNAEVQAQAPGNPRIQKVIEEVQQHLDRYPSIAHDVGLQNVVGKAIFDWLQKTI